MRNASAGVSIIAEVGSNYDGSLPMAERYIRAIRAAGADAVKFQTLRRDKLVAPKVWIEGRWADNPRFQNFSNLELPDEWHGRLKEVADEEGVEFISTPFYVEAVELLEKVGVRRYKIASGDLTFMPLLEAVGRTAKQVILSTGASSLTDVERAIDVLQRSGSGEITLLHCVSSYPPQWDEMNLRVLPAMRERFGLPVGISDHSPGDAVPIAAVALGAAVIEKHVTFDRCSPGPDHPFAMTIEEFADMVTQVRRIEQALGTGDKVPTPSEIEKQDRMRRGIYDPGTFEPSSRPDGVWLRPVHKRT